MTFNELKIGEAARITGFVSGGDRSYRQALLAMGLTPGVCFHLSRVAPFGDPIEITLRGYALSLRKHEAAILKIERVLVSSAPQASLGASHTSAINGVARGCDTPGVEE